MVFGIFNINNFKCCYFEKIQNKVLVFGVLIKGYNQKYLYQNGLESILFPKFCKKYKMPDTYFDTRNHILKFWNVNNQFIFYNEPKITPDSINLDAQT